MKHPPLRRRQEKQTGMQTARTSSVMKRRKMKRSV